MQIIVNLYFNKMMKKVYHSSSHIIYVDKPFRKQTPKPTDFEHLFFQADKRFLEILSLKSTPSLSFPKFTIPCYHYYPVGQQVDRSQKNAKSTHFKWIISKLIQ